MTNGGARKAVVIPETVTDVVFGGRNICWEETPSLGHC